MVNHQAYGHETKTKILELRERMTAILEKTGAPLSYEGTVLPVTEADLFYLLTCVMFDMRVRGIQ